MYLIKRNYGVIILFIFLSTNIFAQQRNWSQNDKNQLSPYEVYLEVQEESNRTTNKTTQLWNSGSSGWENSGQSIYNYGYYNTALNYYALLSYYYYYYSAGMWNPAYYYYYYYNTMGYLSGYDYYGWYDNAWVLYGTGSYSNHNSWGEWGTETYTNIYSMSGRESSMTDRYFDADGNVTDEYDSYWDGNSYQNLTWTNTAWDNGYYKSKTYRDWNNVLNMWEAMYWYQYNYAYGYSTQVPQSFGYLYGGSPSSWTRYDWYNSVWNPYQHCSYGYQDGYDYYYGYGYNIGYTTMATYYNTYNSATNAWSSPSRQTYYSYYAGPGKATNQMDISNFRLKLVEQADPGASADEWDKSERVWISYEDEGYKVATESEMSVPSNFNLKQNYPNPFNPVTTINFDLSENTNVKLSIYDMAGRLINELANAEMNIGNHSVDWNGLDVNGKNVSAGIYLYKLQTDKFTQTKKMILLR